MELKSITIRNFKALQNIHLTDIPNFIVLVGANGTGKSTLFDVFGFLRDALTGNVRQALDARGRFPEVVTRGHEKDSILVELQVGLPIAGRSRLVTFKTPFLDRYVSDGTIKMFAYLVLLHDPRPHPLLCIEEPENQLYPTLMGELAEEFRDYARRGGQVMVSTHSPDLLNAVRLEEVLWLVKKDGLSEIRRAQDDAQVKLYMEHGDKMGYLWKQGFFTGVDPA